MKTRHHECELYKVRRLQIMLLMLYRSNDDRRSVLCQFRSMDSRRVQRHICSECNDFEYYNVRDVPVCI